MNHFVLLSVIHVLVFGSAASYTDIRHGKVYNKLLAAGFISGILLLAVFYARAFGGAYLGKVLANGCAALVIGYLFWLKKQWAAGDAKLFAFFAFFVPLSFYQGNYIEVFPSVNLLINTFVIVAAYLAGSFILGLARAAVAGRARLPRFSLNRRGAALFVRLLLAYCLIMFVLALAARTRAGGGIFSNHAVIFFMMYFLTGPLYRRAGVVSIMAGAGFAVMVYLAAVEWQLAAAVIVRATVFLGIIGIARGGLQWCLRNTQIVLLKAGELKPGFVLVEGEENRIAAALGESSGEYRGMSSYGLNARKVEMIRRAFAPEEQFRVYRGFSLAPFVFGGVIATLATSSSLVKLIIQRAAGF